MNHSPLIDRLDNALMRPVFNRRRAKAKVYTFDNRLRPDSPMVRGSLKVLAKSEQEIREAVRAFVEAGGLDE